MPVLVRYLGRPVNPTSVTRPSLANSAGSALYCDKILTIKEFQQELWTMVDPLQEPLSMVA
jgi:hypothetical protein